MKHFSILIILLACITACKSQNKKDVVISPAAKAMNDSALHLFYANPAINMEAAIKLLDQAIALDKNDYEAWGMKSSIYTRMGRNQDALAAAKQVENINPYMPETPYYEGLLYHNMGEESNATQAFGRSLTLFNKVLDTLSATSPIYNGTLIQKAVVLKMLDKNTEGEQILTSLHNTVKDDNTRIYIEMFLNKDKTTILKEFDARTKNQ